MNCLTIYIVIFIKKYISGFCPSTLHWAPKTLGMSKVIRVIDKGSHKPLLITPSVNWVQSLSRVPLFATPWIAALQASLSKINSRSSLRLTSIESVMPSSHLILWRPLLLLPPIPPSIRVFSMSQLFALGGQSIGVSASASVLPMNIQNWFPLGMYWLALLAR